MGVHALRVTNMTRHQFRYQSVANMQMHSVYSFVVLLSLLSAQHAAADTLSLSLQLPTTLLQNSLRNEFGLQDAQETEIFRQGDCRWIQVQALNLALVDQHVQVHLPVRMSYGPNWFGSCLGSIDWHGTVTFRLEPYITADDQLRHRLLETQLLDNDGQSTLTGTVIWTLLKRVMQPRLESFQIDLKPPRRELTEVIQSFVPTERSQEMDVLLASARPTQLQIEADRIVIPLQFDLPAHYLTLAPTPAEPAETPLTPAELEQFATTAQAWDAFLVFVIKRLGLDIQDFTTRIRLAELLLDSRYQAIAILAGETEPGIEDPTRQLFLSAWNELRALVLEASQRGQVNGELLTYLTLLNAGDALAFLDSTAPGLGIEISVDGLRRLARILQGNADPALDPLRIDWSTDPYLQELFELRDEPLPEPTSGWWPVLDLLIRPALAGDSTADPQQLADRLRNWIPETKELIAYRTVVATLLERVMVQEMARGTLTREDQEIVRHLVPATALIESCWRQYYRNQDSITHLRSPAGAIGLMQINPAVWRGIFDVERLKTDAAYNAHAGTRILLRYLRQYARPVAAETGDLTHIARASYAAYNAGPRAARRFLKSDLKPSLRKIDEKFWGYYQAFSEGGEVDLQSCKVIAPI